jgi:hypothetical protein
MKFNCLNSSITLKTESSSFNLVKWEKRKYFPTDIDNLRKVENQKALSLIRNVCIFSILGKNTQQIIKIQM